MTKRALFPGAPKRVRDALLLDLAGLLFMILLVIVIALLTGCGSAWAVDFNDDGTLKSIKLDGRVVPVVQEAAVQQVIVPAEPEPLGDPVVADPVEITPPVPATPFSRARDLLAQLEAAGRWASARDLCQKLTQMYGQSYRYRMPPVFDTYPPRRRPRAIDDPLRNGAGAFDDLDRLLRSGDRMQPH